MQRDSSRQPGYLTQVAAWVILLTATWQFAITPGFAQSPETQPNSTEEIAVEEPVEHGTLNVTGSISAELIQRIAALTVTIRGRSESQVANNGATDSASLDGNTPSAPTVIVVSGVSLGDGLLVSHGIEETISNFRVTLSDGEQTKADLQVVDHYSGLCLLETEHKELPTASIAKDALTVGDFVISAASAGIEAPSISTGIVSCVNRTMPGIQLPVLECNLATSETSIGSGVFDRRGYLVGILAGTSNPNQKQGWAFAVPIASLDRLMRSRKPGQIVVLKRRRPTVGLVLGPGEEEGTVRVERITPGGPADVAGIKEGDLILATDDRKIRSAYQAVSSIVAKLPGDSVNLVVERNGEVQEYVVRLGSSSVVEAAASNVPGEAGRNPSYLKIRAPDANRLQVTSNSGAEEVAVDPQNPNQSARAEIRYLRERLAAYERLTQELQKEIDTRREMQEEMSSAMRSLIKELERLRPADEKKPDSAKPESDGTPPADESSQTKDDP